MERGCGQGYECFFALKSEGCCGLYVNGRKRFGRNGATVIAINMPSAEYELCISGVS